MSRKSDSQRSHFIPEPVKVWLGRGESVVEYEVTPAAWVTLYKLKDLLRNLLEEVTDLWNQEILQTVREIAGPEAEANGRAGERLQALLVNPHVWELVDALLAKPQEFFHLAIPDLDLNLFDEGNPNGATIPQVWATFEVIARVNRLEMAKNLLGVRPTPN